jgi:hypothetical protein
MAFFTGQTSVGTTVTTICQLPAGPGMFVLQSDSASASECYFGGGTALTSSNGVPLPVGGQVSAARYQGEGAATIYGICASGSASVGFVVTGARSGGANVGHF